MTPTRSRGAPTHLERYACALRLPLSAIAVWRSLSVCGSRADGLDPATVAMLVAVGAVVLDSSESGALFVRRAECTVVAM
jgi:hypothetical protein